MQSEEFEYNNINKSVLNDYIFENRTESTAFLCWFLENVLRLDEVSAADTVCDGPGDRGIDGIYVDHDNSEILFLQSKIRKKENVTVGDAPIRALSGSVSQFNSSDKVSNELSNIRNSELGKLVTRTNIAALLIEGYACVGMFVTNSIVNAEGRNVAENLGIRIYDRNVISAQVVDVTTAEGVSGSIELDISETGVSTFDTGQNAKLYVSTVSARDLIRVDGLTTGALFSQNVRLNLGNTRVNKDIRKTIQASEKHVFFPMYHNGITFISDKVQIVNDRTLKLTNYVVVNGAQSLSALLESENDITDDLHLIVKVVENIDQGLSREITLFSNNQNSPSPRDKRSNHKIQMRLKQEFENIDFEEYRYLIKRGEQPGNNPVFNDDAGRLLLAFDIKEPWSCHQIYKVFDEKYAEIFGRPIVDAWRIILLDKIMERILISMVHIENEPIQNYRLTKYFLLYALSQNIDGDELAKETMNEAEELVKSPVKLSSFLDGVEGICGAYCVDLKYELDKDNDPIDYRVELKSQTGVTNLEKELRRSFERDVARGKERRLSTLLETI